MTDVRNDLARVAEALAGLAKEASYVAIGAGVIGFHKAQVRRQELAGAPLRPTEADRASARPGREQMARRAKEFDATVAQVIKVIDSTLEPVFLHLPEPVQAAVQQAREARDELRARVFGLEA
jgi:hypothetical protein